jgi:predicted permease
MKIVFEQLSILYLFLLAGWLIGKLKKEKASHADILSVLLVNILLPCKIFITFADNVTVEYMAENYRLLILSVVLLAVLSGVSFFLPKLLTKNGYERRVYAYSIPITNYGYLGYALIGSVFGDNVLAQFMLFAIPFSWPVIQSVSSGVGFIGMMIASANMPAFATKYGVPFSVYRSVRTGSASVSGFMYFA